MLALVVMPARPALPHPIYGADTCLSVNVEHWVKEVQAGTLQQGRTMVVELLH
jgi:hypothetical protein